MSQLLPDAIEQYLAGLNRRADPVLETVAREGHATGLPIVHTDTGALLHVLALTMGARRILEIGTANGYSGICLARALPPDGLFVSIEVEASRAALARANFKRAGLEERANVMVGDAARLVAKVSGPFDLIFQDSDKAVYEPMLDRLVELLRPSGVLVTDNALWNGEVVPGYVERPEHDEASTRAIAAYNRRLAADARLQTVFLPVGDGVAISIKSG